MSKTIDVALKPAQYEVFSSKKRFRVLVAGRRFGKSYLACIELLQKAAASEVAFCLFAASRAAVVSHQSAAATAAQRLAASGELIENCCQ